MRRQQAAAQLAFARAGVVHVQHRLHRLHRAAGRTTASPAVGARTQAAAAPASAPRRGAAALATPPGPSATRRLQGQHEGMAELHLCRRRRSPADQPPRLPVPQPACRCSAARHCRLSRLGGPFELQVAGEAQVEPARREVEPAEQAEKGPVGKSGSPSAQPQRDAWPRPPSAPAPPHCRPFVTPLSRLPRRVASRPRPRCSSRSSSASNPRRQRVPPAPARRTRCDRRSAAAGRRARLLSAIDGGPAFAPPGHQELVGGVHRHLRTTFAEHVPSSRGRRRRRRASRARRAGGADQGLRLAGRARGMGRRAALARPRRRPCRATREGPASR